MTKKGRIAWIKFHADLWITGTAKLSNPERGVYITLCAYMWAHEGPLEYDRKELASWCRISTRMLDKLLASLEKKGKIEVRDGFVFNSRAIEELNEARTNIEKWSENLPNRPPDSGPDPTKSKTYPDQAGAQEAPQAPGEQEQEEEIEALAKANAAVGMVTNAYDDAIAMHYGKDHRRAWPSQTDGVTINRWIEDGLAVSDIISALEHLVGSRHARSGGSREPIRSLHIYDNDVRSIIARRADIASPSAERAAAESNPAQFDEERWEANLSIYYSGKIEWPEHWGPAPGEPGCLCPAHLMKPRSVKSA